GSGALPPVYKIPPIKKNINNKIIFFGNGGGGGGPPPPHRAKYLDISSVNTRKVQLKINENKMKISVKYKFC
ncbi:hypothetical protein AB9B09_14630, partial [Escherichia coli]